jgi:hypothetical protein
VDQSSYEAYRRNGEYDKALQFTKDLAAEIRRTGSSTRALWKYILFNHNDRDDQILAAVKMASEIGVPITFDGTVGANASRRTSESRLWSESRSGVTSTRLPPTAENSISASRRKDRPFGSA